MATEKQKGNEVKVKNAQYYLNLCQRFLSKMPSSHIGYSNIINLYILNNPVVIFDGPLGGGKGFREKAYTEIHNIHAKAGCDDKEKPCQVIE